MNVIEEMMEDVRQLKLKVMYIESYLEWITQPPTKESKTNEVVKDEIVDETKTDVGVINK